MKLIKKIKKGFTLVELVVVIAIIAILSGVSVAVYVGITNNAKESACKQEATSVATVLRAMALSDANGYEVTSGVFVTWHSTDGLHFINASGAAVTTGDDALLVELYKKSEALTGDLTFTLADAADADHKADGTVTSFAYKAKASEYTATYNLVTNTIAVAK